MDRATALTVFEPKGRTFSLITRMCCDELTALRQREAATFSAHERQTLQTEISLKVQEIDEHASVARSKFTVIKGDRQ
jgi:hypothetical protein